MPPSETSLKELLDAALRDRLLDVEWPPLAVALLSQDQSDAKPDNLEAEM